MMTAAMIPAAIDVRNAERHSVMRTIVTSICGILAASTMDTESSHVASVIGNLNFT